MKLTKGKYAGVWFLWPVFIYYIGLGVEIRCLKWYVGLGWGFHWPSKMEPLKQGSNPFDI